MSSPDPRRNLFSTLRLTYGQSTVKLVRRLANAMCTEEKFRQHATFNHRCLHADLVPRGFCFRPPVRSPSGLSLAKNCAIRFQKMWLKHCHHKIQLSKDCVSTLMEELRGTVSSFLFDRVVGFCKDRVHSTKTCVKERHLSKFQKLQEKCAKIPSCPSSNPPCVVNLSRRKLSSEENTVLQKSLKFAPSSASPPIRDILTTVEAATGGLSPQRADEIRYAVAHVVKKFRPKFSNMSYVERTAMRSLKEDDTIIILPADKGNATVILDKSDYDSKIRELLDDQNTYRREKSDPTRATEQKLNSILLQIKKAGRLAEKTYWSLHASGSQCPRFYGLPKIHKEGTPLRPIVSFINSPSYKSARHLADILSPYAKANEYRLENSAMAVNDIRNTILSEDEVMVSYDVKSLFTCIPTDLAITIIRGKLESDESLKDRTSLSVNDICNLVEFCLNSNFFSFGGQFYRQVFGTAMGSPLSPVVADIVMEWVESTTLSTYQPGAVRLWRRYVDDILAIIKCGHVETFLRHLNSTNPHIQFTFEREHDGKLPFLDILISRSDDGKLETSVFRKATHTDRYLPFSSAHPQCHKIAVAKTLFARAKTHCSSDDALAAETEHIFRTLEVAGYPKRLLSSICQGQRGPPLCQDPAEKKIPVVLPFVSGMTEPLSRILRGHGFQVFSKPVSSLRGQLVHPKDPVPHSEQSNVVYKIPCTQCDKCYVGETMRRLTDRLKEHRTAVRMGDVNLSAVAEHSHLEHHLMDWDATEVVAKEASWRKRKLKEAIAITESSPTLNRDGGFYFPPVYHSLLQNCEKT